MAGRWPIVAMRPRPRAKAIIGGHTVAAGFALLFCKARGGTCRFRSRYREGPAIGCVRGAHDQREAKVHPVLRIARDGVQPAASLTAIRRSYDSRRHRYLWPGKATRGDTPTHRDRQR
jgi:hypothetical protein